MLVWRILALLGLSACAAQPYLTSMRVSRGADMLLHTYRLVALRELVQQGIAYSVWFPNLAFGYGYPIFLYYAPLTQYVALGLSAFGLSPAMAVHGAMVLALFAAVIGAYAWLRDVWGERAGFVGAACFALAPYTLYNIYVRAALAELMAVSLLPLALFCLRRTLARQSLGYALAGAWVYAAILLSHNITALLVTPVLLFYGLLLMGQWRLSFLRGLQWMALFVGLGLALSAFFWWPALAERNLSQLDRALSAAYDFRGYFLGIETLLALPHSVDPYLVNITLTASVSGVVLGLAVLGLLRVWLGPVWREQRLEAIGFACIALIFLLMTLPLSQPIWERLPLMHFVLYPFRFLGVGSLFIAALAAACFAGTWSRWSRWPRLMDVTVCLCVAALALYAWTWQLPSFYQRDLPQTASDIGSIERQFGIIGTTSLGEYLPREVQQLPQQNADPKQRLLRELLPSEVRVVSETNTLLHFAAEVQSQSAFTATFSQFAFAGWQARLDGTVVSIAARPTAGLISVQVPAGLHTIEVVFTTTPLRAAMGWVSIAAVGVSVLLLAFMWRTRLNMRSQASSAISMPQPLLIWVTALLIVSFSIKSGYIDRTNNAIRNTRLMDNTVSGAAIQGPARFADQLVWLGADAPVYEAQSHAVAVDLFWRKAQANARDMSVMLRLVDPSGESLATHDVQNPDNGLYPVSNWEMDQYARDPHRMAVPTGVPPGRYLLRVAVYEHNRPDARLPIADAAGFEQAGDELIIGSVEITRSLDMAVMKPVSPSITLNRRIDGTVTLLGADVPLKQIRVGESLPLNLYWQADGTPKPDGQVCFHLVRDGQSKALPCREWVPGFASQLWQRGDVWRGIHRVKLPPTLTRGDYELQADVDGQRVALGPLHLEAPTHTLALSAGVTQQSVVISDWVSLAGFVVPPEIKAGETLTVQVFWRGTGETNGKYKAFVQLRDGSRALVAEHSDTPAQGAHPTSTWIAGEYIDDVHPMPLPQNLAAGDYRLVVGLYNEFTGQRILLPNGEDAVTLKQPVTVK